jgi:glycosyltransferase involved in cell wall biosynthesis
MASEIVVNGRFHGRRTTGAERYASEILRCLGPRVQVIKPRRPLVGSQADLWEQLVLPRSVGEEQLLWSPAGSGPLTVTQQAVTIHDLSVLDHAEWFDTSFRRWQRFLLPRLTKRARAVLATSEHSRRLIFRRFGLSDEAVVAVPGGVNLDSFRPCDAGPVRAKYELNGRYILYVGSIEPRKNVERLLQAWFRLMEFRDLTLVIAGAEGQNFRPVALGASRRRARFLGYVPEDDLPGLYSGAALFIMPSLQEGLGLAVLEAMACGTPVVTSYAGALPEVAGDAAIQVDPTSVEGMAEAMRSLLVDKTRCEDLSGKGLERARQFTWERSAQAVLEVLEANL